VGKKIKETDVSKSSSSIEIIQICPGSYLLKVAEADIAWVFNPWPDISKYLIRKQLDFNGVVCPDSRVQNGVSCNLIEFPLLHAMFVQGMIFRGEKPTLVGTEKQIRLGKESFKRGLYGFYDVSEMENCDLSQTEMENLMREIESLAVGGIKEMDELMDFVPLIPLEETPSPKTATNYNGVRIWKEAINVYGVEYKEESAKIDCNLASGESYIPPLDIDTKNIPYASFQIIDTGEEDGFSPKSCLHTIIQWRNKIICIDLPMNSSYLLDKVSLSKNEIDAVIFTHNHDDHIGDISILLQMDKKVTVLCPKIIWKSILLKASNMLDMSIEDLSTYFDYRPILYGEEYDYVGLRILAHPSLHPVPCAIYRIRGIVDQEWKVYGHMSDILNFKRCGKLLEDGSITQERYQAYRDFVLDSAQVKKIDVGARTGTEDVAVHGAWRDFLDDTSEHIVLAHINREHLEEEATVLVGQVAFAGSARNLSGNKTSSLRTTHDISRQRSINFLRDYMCNLLEDSFFTDSIREEQLQAYIEILADNEIRSIQPQTPFLKRGEKSDFACMLISGSASVWIEENGSLKQITVAGAGDLIGDIGVLEVKPRNANVRSENYVHALQIPATLFREVAVLFEIYNPNGGGVLQRIWQNRPIIQASAIFGQNVPFRFQNKVAQYATKVSLDQGQCFFPDNDGTKSIYLGKSPEHFSLRFNDHEVSDIIEPIFGENNLLTHGVIEYQVVANRKTTVLKVELGSNLDWIMDVPLFKLRLTELASRRKIELERTVRPR